MEPRETKVYASRWWVLAVYSCFAFLQGWYWAIPGTISPVMEAVNGLSTGNIQFLVNWGPITFIPFSVPIGIWIDKDLRLSTIFSIALVALGSVLRCFALDASETSIVLLHLSYICNGIAGPVAMGAVSLIAERFFPVSERSTATALMAEANSFGLAAAFLVGPNMITSSNNVHQLLHFYILCSVLIGLNLVAALCYYPPHPPTPPTKSAQAQQTAESKMTLRLFMVALWRLAQNRQFWVLCVSYGMTTGIYGAWGSVLSTNLAVVNPRYTQAVAGWMGFSATACGNIGGVIMGRFADRFHKLKSVIVVFLLAAAACFLAFTLCAAGSLDEHMSFETQLPLLVLLCSLGGFFLNSTIPLFFEASAESTFPLPEGVTLCMLTNGNNLGALIFLALPYSEIPGPGMNLMITGAIGLFGVFLLVFFRDDTRRLDFDFGKQSGLQDDVFLEDDAHHGQNASLLSEEATVRVDAAALN